QTRRVLEAEFVGGLPHANAQLLDQLRLLSLQKEDDLAHAPSVLLLRNVEDAGGRTALDLVEQAGPRPPLQHRVRAGPKLEVPVDEPQRLPDGGCTRIGSEVARAILANAPHHLQARIGMPLVEPQADVGLVVAEADVEARLVPLDQGVFEEERFLLAVDQDDLDVAEDAIEQGYEGAR